MRNYSRKFSLNLTDFQRGLIMTIGGAIFGIVMPILEKWFTEPGFLLPQINWALVLKTAISAGSVYLMKNFFTPPPKEIMVDASKTTVIDKNTQEELT